MKKKALLFFVLITFQALLFAQCPVDVTITPNPSGATCKNTPIDFTATPINASINPTFIWVLNGDTVSNNTPNFSTAVNGAQVELYLTGNSGCTQDIAYTSYYINSITLSSEYNVIIEECNQPVADIQILNITGGTPLYTYVLSTAGGNITGSNYFADVPISNYPLIITDSENCKDTSWIDMTTVQCPPIIPQEVFTPNEDGFNDTWLIRNIEFYPKNKIFIFDRWGQRVYHKEGYSNAEGWDAKYMGGDTPVSTYYYVIELEFDKQDKKVFKGPVSILR